MHYATKCGARTLTKSFSSKERYELDKRNKRNCYTTNIAVVISIVSDWSSHAKTDKDTMNTPAYPISTLSKSSSCPQTSFNAVQQLPTHPSQHPAHTPLELPNLHQKL